jgi:signal transduction histidine kinase
VFAVTGARDADLERRSWLLVLVAAASELFVVLASLTSPLRAGNVHTWVVTTPLGIPTLAVTFWLARRARARAAGALLISYVAIAVGVLAWAQGPNSDRMGVAILAVVGSGALLSPRLTAVGTAALAAVIAGLAAAQAAGIYAPPDAPAGAAATYLPFVRQSIALGLLVVVLRRGYDRLWGQVGQRDGELTSAVAAARALNASLEAQVAARTAAIAATHDRLSRLANQLATELGDGLGAVGRDLDDVLAREAALGAEALHDVHRARAAAERLAVMTRRLHEHALAGTAALRPAHVDMTALIRDVVDEFRRGAHGDVDWQLTAVPPAWTDAALIRTVIENLVSNALKFSRDQHPAVIAIGFDPARGYVVRDNGVGFDPQFATGLFQPFRSLHPAGTYEGHGVGLANARRILARLGGEITAEAAPGAGASFAFTLPAEAAR